MEALKGISFPKLPFHGLTKISDLIYYEGPLLSHFRSDDGENFLFYWVDVDEKLNRWLVVQVSYERLLRYLEKKVSLRELILNPISGFVLSVDISEDLQHHNVILLQPTELPSSYLPEERSFYEFEPKRKEIDLLSLSKKYGSGLLQASIRNSSKVGYGTIYLSVLTPALQSINEMGEMIATGLWEKSKSGKTTEQKSKKVIENRYKPAGEYEFVTTFPGSFSIILRPISVQTTISESHDESDDVAESLINFISSSYNVDRLKTAIDGVDFKVVTELQRLLKTISDAKLEFSLHWANARSHFERSQKITFREADKILENIQGLEYENVQEVTLTGRFVEVNLRTRHYIFESTDNKSQSTGYFAANLQKTTSRISFNVTYVVKISRAEKKEALKSVPVIKDIIISLSEKS